ncbi:unnamed protein product [Amaranthus hypochondriacus]
MKEENIRKGPWYQEEDDRLKAFVTLLGARRWDSIARISGLQRSGKSCRLRWLNYLRPYLKHSAITPQEEQIILQLHQIWGNKWAKIARRLPGRTDNEIKNYWRTHLKKKIQIPTSLLNYNTTSSSSSNVFSMETSSLSDNTNNYLNHIMDSLQEGESVTTIETSINCKINTISTEKSCIGPVASHNIGCDYSINKGVESDCMITNSPYEIPLTNWLNMLSTEQSEDLTSSIGCFEKIDSPEFCFDYPMNWSCLGEASAWDELLDSKWDMDLFNNVKQ